MTCFQRVVHWPLSVKDQRPWSSRGLTPQPCKSGNVALGLSALYHKPGTLDGAESRGPVLLVHDCGIYDGRIKSNSKNCKHSVFRGIRITQYPSIYPGRIWGYGWD